MWGCRSRSSTRIESSRMLRNWSTDLSVPVMQRSFLSSTVTSVRVKQHQNDQLVDKRENLARRSAEERA